ncbi:acyl carrier protein [Companilactobacillus ginsenosidimutans]|uniref:Acyl carrier protein n=1 Tax=Companilactobacillus ginsenosidimutans TaxID=1007676 RepID=A0A0H4QYX9_9LACO|nr:acyl carrier protein [Companilactobacillus ginsenosidimutans]AKP66700.1 acyl carrier protein [Companilactobacillus ginsenosidimutans]
MSEQEIFDKITALLADKFEVEQSSLTRGTSFTKDLDGDSIDYVEFVLELEEEFGAEIPDEDAEKIATVGDAVDYIKNNQK